MKKIAVLILAGLMTLSVALCAGCSDEALKAGEGTNLNSLADRDLKRGTYMALSMYEDFYEEKYEYAHRNLPALETESDFSDCWRYTGLFSMMLRCDELNDKKYTDVFENLVSGFDYYKGRRSGYRTNINEDEETMYTVFAVNRGNQKFRAEAGGQLSVFDDQIWIAREYLNAYNLYGKKEYLDTAVELSNYIYRSGWMPVIGGITWGQTYDTRHSCSNAPFVKVLVELAEAVESRDAAEATLYRDWATNVYEWTYSTLRDPSDNLYWDLVGTIYDSTGMPLRNDSIDEAKYTYNSGAMISAGVAMYNMTGEQRYLDEAKATAESCYNRFGVHDFIEGYTMYPADTTTWFNLVMYIGYYDLFLADNTMTVYLDDLQRTIDYAYENFGRDGYIPIAWLVGWEAGWEKSDHKNLLDHTSHAETYLLLAQYQQKKAELEIKS